MPVTCPTSDSRELLAPVRNERGVALILVLIMIVLLGILGATVLTSTTSDLHITTNYRNLDDAFLAADAGMDFSQANGIIYSALLPATATVWPAPTWGAPQTIVRGPSSPTSTVQTRSRSASGC